MILRTGVIGANGFVGRHLLRSLREADPTAPGTARRPIPGLARLDLTTPEPLGKEFDGCEYVVITAAVPKIDDCERDPDGTRRVNVTGTVAIIWDLWGRGVVPVFLSSDYVFAGTAADGYDDFAPTAPTTEYGRQKAEVEAILAADGRPYLILRLGKVFGLTRGDGTLLDEMAAALTAGRPVRAATDQVFCSVWITDAVDAIRRILEAGLRGPVNVCPDEPWSRYDLARAVARAVGADESVVHPMKLADMPGPARRPTRTRMVPTRLAGIGVRFTPMADCLARLAEEYRRA